MSRELQDQLAKTYPQMFGDLSFPTFPPSRSLACGDRWYRLIERLCHCVQALTDESRSVQHVTQQVKERFGALRFYWFVSDDRVDAMTELAEALSSFTCEECGALRVRNPSGRTNNSCTRCRGEARAQ